MSVLGSINGTSLGGHWLLLVLAVLFAAVARLGYLQSRRSKHASAPLPAPLSEKEQLQLDSIPGPPECKARHIFTQGPIKEHWNILALHRQYGPVVRIGPNHVSVADIDSVKLIYGQATPFHKTEWYNLFTEEGKGVIFNLRDKTMHAKRRQLVSGAFSLTSTRQLLPFIRAKALAVLRDVDQVSKSGARLEVASLMRRFAGDVSLKLSLGIDERQVETGASFQLVDDLVARASADIPTRTLASRLERLGPLLSLSFAAPADRLATASRIVRANTTIRKAVAHFCRRFQSGEADQNEMLGKIVGARDAVTGTAMDFETLCMEARGFILAASDTTANTLTMAIYHIARTPGVWARLHAELTEAIPSREALQDDVQEAGRSFADLPYLTACIKETYRLSPAIAKLLPRYVPAGGAQVGKHTVPAGTHIGASIFVYHRWQEDLWGAPEYADDFHPDRWLTDDDAKLKRMNSLLSPFSLGTRACLGRHIAEFELYVLLATLFRFYAPVAVHSAAEAMTEVGFFIAGPMGKKLEITVRGAE